MCGSPHNPKGMFPSSCLCTNLSPSWQRCKPESCSLWRQVPTDLSYEIGISLSVLAFTRAVLLTDKQIAKRKNKPKTFCNIWQRSAVGAVAWAGKLRMLWWWCSLRTGRAASTGLPAGTRTWKPHSCPHCGCLHAERAPAVGQFVYRQNVHRWTKLLSVSFVYRTRNPSLFRDLCSVTEHFLYVGKQLLIFWH